MLARNVDADYSSELQRTVDVICRLKNGTMSILGEALRMIESAVLPPFEATRSVVFPCQAIGMLVLVGRFFAAASLLSGVNFCWQSGRPSRHNMTFYLCMNQHSNKKFGMTMSVLPV